LAHRTSLENLIARLPKLRDPDWLTSHLRGKAQLGPEDSESLKDLYAHVYDSRAGALSKFLEQRRVAQHAVKERLQFLAYEPNSLLLLGRYERQIMGRIERRMKELERGQ
jgi:hypothetical protein